MSNVNVSQTAVDQPRVANIPLILGISVLRFFIGGLVALLTFAAPVQAQIAELPKAALIAGGLSVAPGSPLKISELDVEVGANRAIFRYTLTNPLEAEVDQMIYFRFPRLFQEVVASDPRLRELRRLNFLDARIRRDGERMQINLEREVFYGDLNVTPQTTQRVGGRTLLDVLNNLPLEALVADKLEELDDDEREAVEASLEAEGGVLDRKRLGIGLSFVWSETLAPGESKQIVLFYRPYSSFFRFSELARSAPNRAQIERWQDEIFRGFCLNYPENSDLASAFQEALSNARLDNLSRTWAQSSVVDLTSSSGWSGEIEQLFITVDPNLYDDNGRSMNSVVSHAAFCGRQGESLDPEGIIRLSRRNASVDQALPVLFLHSPSSANERDLADSLIVSNLVDEGDCAPANGFLIPCSDMRALSEAEVQPLSIDALMRAQLEIYARRGSYFTDARNQNFFERFSWYEPFTNDPPLSDIEQRNARLIERIRIAKILSEGLVIGGDSLITDSAQQSDASSGLDGGPALAPEANTTPKE